jgi:phasin family protein
MYNASQFAELNQTNVAQATKLAAVMLRGVENVAQLNMNTTKAAIAQGVEGASAVAGVRDAREFFALPNQYVESSFQHVVGYSKGLYELSQQAQAAYSAIAEEALAGYTKGLAAWVEKASASAPAGSEGAINAMKSTVAATSAAFDQFQKASKQVASFADASVRAAAANATKFVPVAPKGRKAA